MRRYLGSTHRDSGNKLSGGRRHHVEVIIIITLFITATALLCAFRNAQDYLKAGDTISFEQALDNLRGGRGMTSDVFSSSVHIINSGALTQGVAGYERAADNYDASHPSSISKFHVYIVLYLLYPLTHLLSSAMVIALACVASFTLMITVVYFWLRSEGLSAVRSALFSFLVMAHPAWGVAISGQFYPDRLFLPLALIFYIAIHKNWAILPTLLFGCLAATVNERAPTILGLFLLGYSVFFFERSKAQEAIWRFSLGLIFLALGYYVQHFIIDNLYYSSFMPVSISDLINRLSVVDFRNKVYIFIAINCGLLFLSLFHWRGFPIAAGMMIPNIVGSIGGAEKTGFPTHYHTYYFPSLVWSAALGYIALSRLLSNSRIAGRWSKRSSLLALLVVTIPVFCAHLVDWTASSRLKLSWRVASRNNIIFSVGDHWRDSFGPEGAAVRAARDTTHAMIPAGSRVSAAEPALWSAGQNGTVLFYPLGMREATHLAVLCEAAPDGSWTWKAVTSFLPLDQQKPIEDAFHERARALGFDVDHPDCGPAPFQVGVISRIANGH